MLGAASHQRHRFRFDANSPADPGRDVLKSKMRKTEASPAPGRRMSRLALALLLLLCGSACRGALQASSSGDDDSGVDDNNGGTGDDDTGTGDDDTGTGDDDTGTGDDDSGAGDDDSGAGDDDSGTGDDDDTPATPVRFIAMGDTGEGNTAQSEVAAVISTVCASQGCDFVILLGDNFYDIGVESVTDGQWDSKFEQPYADINLPFYPALGNHDGGDDFLGGTGINVEQGDNQVDYTYAGSSPPPWGPGTTKWTLPSRWYHHNHANADFYGLDTSQIFFDDLYIPFLTPDFGDLVDGQRAWLNTQLAASPATNWRIAYGHHPYLSNGPHGNAGMYEGQSFIPYADGEEIKNFFDDNVCGNVDLYLCGHDHSRQWLSDTCDGTELMVSGAGAKTSEIEGTNPVYFQDADTEGFVWIEILGNTMTVQWWDRNGAMNYEGTLTKGS